MQAGGWLNGERRRFAAQPNGSGDKPFERQRLGELRADLVAGSPFDDGIGAVAAGQHQPHARADLKAPVGDGHEAVKKARELLPDIMLMDIDMPHMNGLAVTELIRKEFQRINKQREEAGEPLYANPRNLAAGTIKQLDPREVARRKLEIVLYGLGYCEPATALPTSF